MAATPVVSRFAGPLPDAGSMLDIRGYLKQIGRGNAGARSLSRADAQTLFGAMLDGAVGELEMGGILIAFRMKGETLDEIAGALAALQERLAPVPIDPRRPVISIPSYNGARRTANLTVLLAGLLADAGVQVIIHGVRRDPNRVTTCEVIQAMGHVPAASVADAGASLELGNPAFVPIDVLSPAFARLLALRGRLGVRHIGHTLAKLLAPVDWGRYGADHCVRLMSFTHPEFNKLQHALMEDLGARALIMRGSEGEAVAGVKRMARVDWIERGTTRTISDGDRPPMGRPVLLPPAQAALAGEEPVPENVARQVELILAVLGAAGPDGAPVALPQDAMADTIASASPPASPQ